MTFEERIRQAWRDRDFEFLEGIQRQLQDAGYSIPQITRYFAEGTGIPPEVIARIESGAGASGAGPAPTESQPGQGGELSAREVAEAVERQRLGLSSEEDDALVEAARQEESLMSEVVQILSQQQVPWNYDWVYNEGALLPGSLDDPATLLRLYEFFADPDIGLITPTERTMRRTADQPAEPTAEEKVETVREMLHRARNNPIVQAAVRSFAEEQGIHKPTHDALQINLQYGLDLGKAKAIVDIARTMEVDPVKVAEVWKNQEARQGNSDDPHDMSTIGFTKVGYHVIAARYKQGLDVYGTHLMAAIHANDPSLAAKLASDPWALDSGEIDRALGMVGGPDNHPDDPQVQWLRSRKEGEYNLAVPVDKDAIREAVTTLASNWNLTSPMDSTTESVVREIVSTSIAHARASLPNPFSGMRNDVSIVDIVSDVSAAVEARLRALPEYQQLFSKKSAAESEEEYVSRFERKSQEIFGDDLVDPVRAAMMSGNVNTVYQQGLLTDAGESSTRFQDMLARNAETFRRFL